MTESPFHTLSDHRGRVKIEGLPAGKFSLALRHEREAMAQGLKIAPKTLEVEIVAGKTTDLGRITLSPRK